MRINEGLSSTRLEFDRAALGIGNPRVIVLKAGEALYRFASTRNPLTGAPNPSPSWARGAWWLREPDYRTILARRGDGALGFVGRVAAAVQPSWSRMDVSIKAYLREDVEAYIGKGRRQYRDLLPNGMYLTLDGWPDLDQIYVPGMRGTAFAAFQIVRQKIITTDDLRS